MSSVLTWLGEILKEREERSAARRGDAAWYRALEIAMVTGVVAMVLLAESLSMFSCALLIALAATLAGALAGFLFGIPKTVSSGRDPEGGQYTGNTNLEQISDWLTKVLVGAGLVQMRAIYDSFKDFGSYFADDKAKPLGPYGWVVAPALLIGYSVSGFFLAYLWARIYMTDQLEKNTAQKKERKSDAVEDAVGRVADHQDMQMNDPAKESRTAAAAALAAAAEPADATVAAAAAALAAAKPTASVIAEEHGSPDSSSSQGNLDVTLAEGQE